MPIFLTYQLSLTDYAPSAFAAGIAAGISLSYGQKWNFTQCCIVSVYSGEHFNLKYYYTILAHDKHVDFC